MIQNILNRELAIAWENKDQVLLKTPFAETVFDVLDVLDAATGPRDLAFVGFRFDEWTEGSKQRFGVLISDHWLISYSWSDEHATDVDLERID